MLKFLSILLILLVCANGNLIAAQRCGDHLWLYLVNAEGRPIAPSEYQQVKIARQYLNVTDNNRQVNEEVAAELIELPEGISGYTARTFCGLQELRFQLSYHDQVMEIVIKNIPGDAGNFIVQGLPFAAGVYQVDLGGRPIKNCRLGHDTIVENQRILAERLWIINNDQLIKHK